jgi:formylglycine-generating enzyme required for sulfatase activity
MACVTGGAFVRGSADGAPDERPLATVFVQSFLMDTHEVTNEDYERCVADGYCNRPIPFRGYMRPRQPKVGVSWYDAAAYCALVGKRLPTEAEWERAAGGPETQRFPWGDDERPCTHAVVETRAGKGCGGGTTRDVMSTPAGHFGLYDMAGNVWEWVADWYLPYAECGADCQGIDPRGPCGGAAHCPRARAQKVLKGGSWWYPIERARAQARRASGAPNRGPHRFGFRCARDLDAPATPPRPAPSPGSRLGPPFRRLGPPRAP